jgi:aryl-alcohol dehydrogenase-like predicted oxidoreductase
VYANGASEVVLGKAIKAIGCPREAVVVLTKVGTV